MSPANHATLPREGTPETLGERLVAYVCAVNPSWSAQVRAASDDTIAEYVRRACEGDASRLPASYLAFARTCGEDAGGLFDGIRVDTSMRRICQLYAELERFDATAIVPELPIVARYIVGDQISLDTRDRDIEPRVLNTSMGEPLEVVAASWERFTMQSAVLTASLGRFPVVRWCSSSSNSALAVLGGAPRDGALARAAVDDVCRSSGLTLGWPSDGRHRIWVGDDVLVYAEIDPSEAALVRVLGRDAILVAAVGRSLGAVVGAVSSGGCGAQLEGR